MDSKTLKTAALALAGLVLAAGVAAAQDAAPAETMAAAEDWNPVSRSATRAYLADVASLLPGDSVSIRLARTPLGTSAGDYSHTIDDFQFQCRTGQVRMVASTEYGPDGAQTDRFEEEAAWEDIPANSLDAYLKSVACDGDRASGKTWPSIRAYIDAGRPE